MGNAPNGMTKRQRYTLSGVADRIPSARLDDAFAYLVGWFWELRSYIGEYSMALTPDKIPLWLPDKYPNADECATLLAMDRAYRGAMADTIAENDKRRASK